MRTKLFAFAAILAMMSVPVVFAVELPYYLKPIYYVTLSNRFPVTNEFAPTGFVCMVQSNTAPEVDLKTAKLTVKDADIIIINKEKSEDNITLIQGKINLIVDLLVNWDTVTVEEDTDMADIHSVRYKTVYGLDKPRFSNYFKIEETGEILGVFSGAIFKILVPRHKI